LFFCIKTKEQTPTYKLTKYSFKKKIKTKPGLPSSDEEGWTDAVWTGSLF